MQVRIIGHNIRNNENLAIISEFSVPVFHFLACLFIKLTFYCLQIDLSLGLIKAATPLLYIFFHMNCD